MARWFCGLLCNHTKAFWALYCDLACALSPPPHAMTLSSEEASAQPLPTNMHENPLRRDTVNSARLSAVSVDMPPVRVPMRLIVAVCTVIPRQRVLIVVALPLLLLSCSRSLVCAIRCAVLRPYSPSLSWLQSVLAWRSSQQPAATACKFLYQRCVLCACVAWARKCGGPHPCARQKFTAKFSARGTGSNKAVWTGEMMKTPGAHGTWSVQGKAWTVVNNSKYQITLTADAGYLEVWCSVVSMLR